MELSKLQLDILNNNCDKTIVISSAASGKALSNGSIVYTKNGHKKIEDITTNDLVFGEDGLLHKVIGVFPQGKKKEYLVTFSDGNTIKCCNEHLWTFQTESLRSKKSKTWITCSLQEIIEKYPLYIPARAKNNFGSDGCKRKNIFIPMTKPVEFEERKVEIEPYTMGALLGDGSFRTSCFTNEDQDVLKWVDEGLSLIGCSLKYYRNYDYAINSNYKQTFSIILKKYNLWNLSSGDKFIPEDYKYNSVENRLKLLQGIIDTDGYCCGSAYDIVLKSKQLILDIQEICESLGLTAIYSEKKATCTNSSKGRKDCGTVYRLRIKTSKFIPKLHRSTKREAQWKPSKTYSMRSIVNIQETNKESEMTCIFIDSPTHLFLTNHFIVTHNTRLLTEKVRQLLRAGVNPRNIATITFTNMAAAELRQRLGDDYKDGLFVGTIHALANYMLCRNGINTNSIINNEEFDKLFELIKENPDSVYHYEWVLLDEAQDSDDSQFDFLFNMINPDCFFVVGDPKQSIYSFRGSNPRLMTSLVKKGAKIFDMNENYRNCVQVLSFAKRLIKPTGLVDNSISKTSYSGYVAEMPYEVEKIVSMVSEEEDLVNWAILTRTNAQIEFISAALRRAGIPYDTFKQGDLSKEELLTKMKQNTVKILTVHSAKGLEWNNVIVVGMRYYNNEERNVCYVAATRAKKYLAWMGLAKKNKYSF